MTVALRAVQAPRGTEKLHTLVSNLVVKVRASIFLMNKKIEIQMLQNGREIALKDEDYSEKINDKALIVSFISILFV